MHMCIYVCMHTYVCICHTCIYIYIYIHIILLRPVAFGWATGTFFFSCCFMRLRRSPGNSVTPVLLVGKIVVEGLAVRPIRLVCGQIRIVRSHTIKNPTMPEQYDGLNQTTVGRRGLGSLVWSSYAQRGELIAKFKGLDPI